jgi:ferritin-like metal-binding protein YciE
MEKMNDLKDLLKHEIEDLQSVEEQILAALPKMIEKAGNSNLKKALSNHLSVTEQHKNRLEKIMQTLNPEGQELNGKKKGILGIFGGGKHVCKGMKGIIDEGESIMNSNITPEALDAAIIASAQKVEHYEICGYGTARTFARELGMEQIAKQLEQTLNEEYAADDLLTQLAVEKINLKAEKANHAAPLRGRSENRSTEKATREKLEMEPVNSSRSRSAGRNTTAKNQARESSATEKNPKPKNSGTPRSEGSLGSSALKAPADNKRTASNSNRNNRNSGGRPGSSGKSGR